MKTRCPWVPSDKPLYLSYHDEEWGVPEFDDHKLFAKLTLDGMQAGLSWWSILQRRERYYQAFAGFDPFEIAKFDEGKIAELLNNPGIIRNRAKVRAVVNNARCFISLQKERGSFSDYLWGFVGGEMQVHTLKALEDYPSESLESGAMADDLRRHGFKFVGPTICYAFMQAVGMVNDHTVDCFRYQEVVKS